MNITGSPFKIVDQEKECFRITINDLLTNTEVAALRDAISGCIDSAYDIIYIDAKNVNEADLSGVNEVIHSHYTLEKASKKLIFLYRRGSVLDKWVETTGLDKFVATAILPADQ